MSDITLRAGDSALAPTILRIRNNETPVWLQHRWQSGPFAAFINRNGCGHCCTAMAARLFGVDIDPHQEYAYCRTLWGEPTNDQGHWLSAAGVAKILRSLSVPAKEFGVKHNGAKKATEHILSALRQGKAVIFTSDPQRYPDNPFSSGAHWVMAVSLEKDGTILVANSAEKFAPTGIQYVMPKEIEKALFPESTAPPEMTWGEHNRIGEGSGYIVVG
ncbi:MAG: hypothetical protein IJO76_03710 [Clostridia bacterium]|nr:hypothetical protein [Clostridia bacterium]